MNTFLDLLIGLALLYLLTAVVSSFIVEGFASFFNLRGRRLTRLIAQLITGEPTNSPSGWTQDFYKHPLIQALHTPTAFGGKSGPPSYIPGPRYVSALIDLLRKSADQPAGEALDLARLKALLTNASTALPPALRSTLESALANGAKSLEDIRTELEASFDATMERAAGWYKRFAQFWLTIVALVLAVAFNLDSYYVAERLLNDPELRTLSTQTASQIAPPDGSRNLSDLETSLRARIALPAPAQLRLLELTGVDKPNLPALRDAAASLYAANFFNPVDAAAHRVFLDATTPEARKQTYPLLDGALQQTPSSTDCAALKNRSDAGKPLADWQRTIRCLLVTDAKALDDAIDTLRRSGVQCTDSATVINPILCKALLPVVRADSTVGDAAIKSLNGTLKNLQSSQTQLDSQFDSLRLRLPKMGFIGDRWEVITGGNWKNLLSAIPGWLTTALLAGFGAPFWFELLGKLVNLRGTGLKPEETAAKDGKPASGSTT
ncbi:hypothetical protein [uncultured Zoogloea sp.]|uniref:hypothetical protein n=1 Tax=uncultured Zoogloea sp. TaxID=160237 RepID=UPI002624973E|nr:hypothetical protein [uncultured Zoogloea sp.]